ncbi:MAG: chromosomal replication initiator protein DnaA [Verrucomicrobia bacterium]|nr:chromosomal replication initiator protein DnaA [Verrucomicrobiota bacterium]MCG2680837.1 chromosomal replication initiator protein DnaA [Kiritimatiellia bacterium]MBU4246847.1 chromosomal replication initiator protein DnaA [Verrucomicrobiota bacterium]MBU4290407.1 chromosomal replication initiator protein DnaA [Verrucomicrobiota bacterium]MBU4430258.1 chromosomal replication initiator protein DnaA [Verrucomicrobiota bacterium]
MNINLESLWHKVCQGLREQLNADVYARWIAVIIPKRLDPDKLILSVSNDFYQTWLEENYLPLIRESVNRIYGRDLTVQFEVTPVIMPAVSSTPSVEPSATRKPAHTKKTCGQAASSELALNPKYAFGSFVVGPSNSFAHASSLAVAQAPGKAYNPLFIYGGVGLGKTHLMQAIGHYVLTQSKAHVHYLSCEALMNEYIDSLQNRHVKQFRDKYRSTDLLLIDDIHFLTRTSALQEEFFHTFNVLYDAHKQIVMASDRPASEISGLEKRLVTRFEWGLVTELLAPDFETRMAILHSKQKTLNVALDEDILTFIALHICSNIRSLEGALLRLASYASIYQKKISMDLAESLLQSIIEQEKKEPVSINAIQRNVADYFDIRMADMTSKQRSQSVALPRQVAMYLCRSLTTASLPEIGAAFSKTHATVMHACRRINQKIINDQQVKQIITKLSKQIDEHKLSVPGK